MQRTDYNNEVFDGRMRAIREMLKQNKKVGVVAANAGAMSNHDSCICIQTLNHL